MQISTYFKGLATTIAALFFLQVGLAQENYVSGYVITLKGDTLTGWIDYRNWGDNPEKIRFKDVYESSEQAIYTSKELLRFSVADEIYQTAIVETPISNKTSTIPEWAFDFPKKDTVFLQAIIEGEKSLYHHNGYLYVENDGAFDLLVFTTYKKGILTLKQNNYQKQLLDYLAGCSSIESQLGKVRYSRADVKKLFLSYYDCVDAPIKFEKELEQTKSSLGPVLGVCVSTLNFKSPTSSVLSDTEFTTSTNPVYGLFYDAKLPRNRGQWSLYNELLITSYKTSGTYSDIESESVYEIADFELNFTYLKMCNSIRYKPLFIRFPVYLGIGFSNGIVISETNYQKKREKFFTTERTTEKEAVEGARKHEQGLTFSVGTRINNLLFEVKHERGNGMSPFNSVKSVTKRYYFSVGYSLSK